MCERWRTVTNVCNGFNIEVSLRWPHWLTCRTEEEGLRFSQVLVHCISDGHLSVGEGGEGLFISRTHLSLDVIKQQREGPAAKLLHLRDKRDGLRFRGHFVNFPFGQLKYFKLNMKQLQQGQIHVSLIC